MCLHCRLAGPLSVNHEIWQLRQELSNYCDVLSLLLESLATELSSLFSNYMAVAIPVSFAR